MPRNINFRGNLFLFALAVLFSLPAFSQPKRSGVKDVPISTTAISTEEISKMPTSFTDLSKIENIRIGNIQEKLSFNSRGVLLGRESITQAGSGSSTLVLINGQRMSGLTRAPDNNAIDYSNIPLADIERVEVLRDGASTVYGSDAISGVTNFIVRTQKEDAAYANISAADWQNYITEIFRKGNTNGSWQDDTYGEGRIEFRVTAWDIYMLQTLEYYDQYGNRREHVDRKFTKEGLMYEERDYFSCNGMQVHKQANYTEPLGYTFNLFDIPYKKGEPLTGYRSVLPGSEYSQYRLPYDLNSGSISWSSKQDSWQTHLFNIPAPCNQPEDNRIDDVLDRNLLIFLGLSYIIEDMDGGEPFCMYGPGANLTYKVKPNLGVGLDIGYYKGKQYLWDYSRINVMAGAEYFKYLGSGQDFSVSPFAYIGISSLRQKYMNFDESQTNLSGLLGINLGYEFSDRLGLKGSGAVNPVFGENRTATNFRLDIGGRLRF